MNFNRIGQIWEIDGKLKLIIAEACPLLGEAGKHWIAHPAINLETAEEEEAQENRNESMEDIQTRCETHKRWVYRRIA